MLTQHYVCYTIFKPIITKYQYFFYKIFLYIKFQFYMQEILIHLPPTTPTQFCAGYIPPVHNTMEEKRNFQVIGILDLNEFKSKIGAEKLQLYTSKAGKRYATNSNRELVASVSSDFSSKLPAYVWHFEEVDSPEENSFWLISNTAPSEPDEVL